MENVMDTDNKPKAPLLQRMRRWALVHDTRGLNTVEYAILLVLIVFISYGLWKSFGQSVGAGVQKANSEIKLGEIEQLPPK